LRVYICYNVTIINVNADTIKIAISVFSIHLLGD